MYLGKVKISKDWTKLEDLIKAQIEGQSSFAFDADTKYQIQGEGEYGCRLCDTDSTPEDNFYEGDRIAGTQVAIYKPSSLGDLYVRTETGMPSEGYVKIDVMGD